jgi:hypothetical protein
MEEDPMHIEVPGLRTNFRSATRWSARSPLLAIVGATALTLVACQREEVQHFRVPKATPAPSLAATPASAGMAPAGMAGDVPPAATPTGADALRWKLPRGWTEARSPGGMRYATLAPPASEPKVDVSVVVLPGPAGGELANVNRWRGQIGLPSLDEAALGAARKRVKARAGEVSLYDFSSEGAKKTRVVAGFTVTGGNTWFVKMSGDADAVATHRSAFVSLLESLRLDAAN